MATKPECPDTDESPDCNNNGTVKVHTQGDIGSMENDPHVDCPFYVEGFNMDASHGSLVIKSWPPTGAKTVVMDTTWTADSGGSDSHHFLNGPYTLPSGHYKLFVEDTKHDKMKVFWVDCDTPQPPGDVQCAAQSDGIHVTWDAQAGATSYDVYRMTGTSGIWMKIGSSTTTGYTDSTAASGQTYHYAVSSHAHGMESARSDACTIASVPFFPSGFALGAASLGGLGLTMLVFRRRK
jgi:hypothetical protein